MTNNVSHWTRVCLIRNCRTFDRNNFTSQHLKECICLFNVHCAMCTHLNCQVMCLWSVSICVCFFFVQLLRIDVTFFFGSLYWKRLHITQQEEKKTNEKIFLQGIEFIQDATRSESSGKTMKMRWNERRIHTNKKKKNDKHEWERWRKMKTIGNFSMLFYIMHIEF